MTELEVFQKSLEVSRATLAVSVVLSVSSVVFAALEMAFQRSHNKKSVKPLCDIRVMDGEGAGLGVWNLGLGPMIIKDILLEGQGDAPGSALSEVFASHPSGLRLARIHGGQVLPPGGGLTLVECAGRTGKAFSFLKESLSGRTLVVEYEDIYEKRFSKEAVLEFES